MSASLAGKFQDHYALLGVDPKANSEAIQAAYAKLAQKYRKDNPEFGDAEKFEAVNQAYEVLCDATLRAAFDKIKGIDQDDGNPQFGGIAFFDSLSWQTGLRAAVVAILYERRQRKPYRPSLSMRHLEGMLNVTNEELNFALWYLKQRSQVQSDDKSNLEITVEGMDFLEATQIDAEMVVRYLKPTALAPLPAAKPAASPTSKAGATPAAAGTSQTSSGHKEKAHASKTAAKTEDREPVMKVLSRALARR